MSDVPSIDPPPPRLTLAGVALLLLVLVIGATLRYMRATADGLTFDEIWHVELALARGTAHGTLPHDVVIQVAGAVTSLDGAGPWYTVWTRMTGVVHPPLYPAALRPWLEMFGTGDLATKSFSILCQLVAIALLFETVRLARRTDSLAIAFWAAMLFAIAPTQVYFAQVVRGYAMLQMWGCAVLLMIVRIERFGPSRTRTAMLCLSALALALTHYFGIAADLAVGAYVLARFRGHARRDAFAALIVAGGIYLVIWGPFMWAQQRLVAETADNWLVERGQSTFEHARASFTRLLAVPVWQFLSSPNWDLRWPTVVGGAFLLTAILLVRRVRELQLWVYWFGGTLLFVAALDATRSTKQLVLQRYTSLAAPAIFAVIALLVWQLRIGVFRHALLAALVVVALARPEGLYRTRGGDLEWHLLGALLNNTVDDSRAAAAADREPLIFYSGSSDPWFNDVLFLGTGYAAPQLFPRPVVRLSKPADEALVREIRGDTAVLISGRLDRRVEQVLPGTRILEQRDVPNLFTFTRVALPTQAPRERAR